MAQPMTAEPSADVRTLIHYEVKEGVAYLTLDDPPANTYTHEMMRQLDEAVLKAASASSNSPGDQESSGTSRIPQAPYFGESRIARHPNSRCSTEAAPGRAAAVGNDEGDTIPTATFERREDALLGASALPGTGRDPRFRLASEPDDRGYPDCTPAGARQEPALQPERRERSPGIRMAHTSSPVGQL